MAAAACHLNKPRADLRRADQGTYGNGRFGADTARLQQGEQMNRNDCSRRAAQDGHEGNRHEETSFAGGKGVGPLRCRRGAFTRGARQRDEMERQAHRQLDGCIDEARSAPAADLDQPGRERPAERA